MAISSISSSMSSFVQKTTSGGTSQTTGLAAIQEEANELPAETRKEALSGDQVAIRKLQAQQQTQAQQEKAPVSELGKGQLIDRKA
jgi:hypothetical protein